MQSNYRILTHTHMHTNHSLTYRNETQKWRGKIITSLCWRRTWIFIYLFSLLLLSLLFRRNTRQHHSFRSVQCLDLCVCVFAIKYFASNLMCSKICIAHNLCSLVTLHIFSDTIPNSQKSGGERRTGQKETINCTQKFERKRENEFTPAFTHVHSLLVVHIVDFVIASAFSIINIIHWQPLHPVH